MIQWHRLFGLTLTDFFLNSAFEVELEKDLSLRQQLLDVVIIKKRNGKAPDALPDGLENLALHNLMTYKSHQQTLDAWAIEELCGHYVNYRKQIRSSSDQLLPMENFQLYAVSARYPGNLSAQIDFLEISPGVYDIHWGIRDIRVIVLSRIPKSRGNAPWLMFSAETDKVKWGVSFYRWNSPVSSVIRNLFQKYQLEGMEIMPYTMEDYQREVKEEVLKSLSKEDIYRLLDQMKREEIEEIEEYLKKTKKETDS